MSDIYICPACSSIIHYDPYFKQFVCRQCGMPITELTKKLESITVSYAMPAEQAEQLRIVDGIPLDRLTQMCEAERGGMCFTPPVKVWSVVYHIFPSKRIVQCAVKRIQYNKDCGMFADRFGVWRFADEGVTWFRTFDEVNKHREAAEAKGAV